MKKDFSLYKVRKIGDKVNVTFDFIATHWRLWLKSTVYLLLPLCLVQAFCLNGYIGGYVDMNLGNISGMNSTDFLLSYAGSIIFGAIGSLLMSAMVYAMMRRCNDNGGSLENVTYGDLTPLIKSNVLRGFLVALVMLVVAVVIVLLIVSLMFIIESFGFIVVALVCVAAVAVAMPLMLAMPICMLEDKQSVISVFRRSFRLGWPVWGGTFALAFVVSLLANILQGVLSIPWYIVATVKSVLSTQDEAAGFLGSVWFNFGFYLLAVAQTFVSYLASSFLLIALGYQYGNAAEKVEAVSVDKGIHDFEHLADKDELDNFEKLV